MLRARLAVNAIFNLILALWVWHDARTRGARKPAFAALITVLWGPLGLGFWASDRPLAAGEQRAGGTGWTLARGLAMAWAALLPAVVTLVIPEVRNRAAVPGSVGAVAGIPAAAAVATLLVWGAPLLLVLAVGWMVRRPQSVESGSSSVTPGRPSLAIAVALAALVAWLYAWHVTVS